MSNNTGENATKIAKRLRDGIHTFDKMYLYKQEWSKVNHWIRDAKEFIKKLEARNPSEKTVKEAERWLRHKPHYRSRPPKGW